MTFQIPPLRQSRDAFGGLIIIIIIFIGIFMQGIYNYVPEMNHVPRVYSVAAALYLHFVVNETVILHVKCVLYFYVSTLCSRCAVLSMAVFCISFISCFSDKLFRYCLSDFEMLPVTLFITDVALVFTFHVRCFSIVRSLNFRIFSASFLITFLYSEIATYINTHVPFFIITDYDVLFIVWNNSVGLPLLIP